MKFICHMDVALAIMVFEIDGLLKEGGIISIVHGYCTGLQ